MSRFKYPVDTDQFKLIREQGLVYVDKTDLLFDLVSRYRYVFLALEIGLECVAQQRLAETARTGKKDILILVDKTIHHTGLVNIHLAIFTNSLKLVGIYWILELTHIICILSIKHFTPQI